MGVLVNLAGVILAALVVWWFWVAKPRPRRAESGPVAITMADGAFEPAVVEVAAGRPVTLRVTRRDPAPHAAQVLFPDLDRVFDLPLDEPRSISLPSLEPGNYEFTCQMRLYVGRLVAA
ncbi:cupredoxin domain-containing protein [Thiohalospira sp.]|uniref:cupredoxin domain-containing protein n=1 Tax=Thiohalospira sp. TaxID=3080549 RepID=UPI0039814D77